WPRPADTTLPRITSSIRSGGTPARATASFTTIAPRAGALNPFREPRSFPVGTRTAERITASRMGLPCRRGPEAVEIAGGAREEAVAQLGILDAGGLGEEVRRGRRRHPDRGRGRLRGGRYGRRSGLHEAERARGQSARDRAQAAQDLVLRAHQP